MVIFEDFSQVDIDEEVRDDNPTCGGEESCDDHNTIING